jgi:eukaryotic-like serine/threonine-protein kinase
MSVATDILPPRYRSPERVGVGGMGEIYRAEDTTLGRHVAIKVLSDRYAEDASVRQRFKREALAAARLSGEASTVTIFDVGEWNERPFIVMEYLGGGSIAARASQTLVPTSQALRWLDEAASALDSAHAHGIVHRDVKPANLLLDGSDRVHVADFGIASAAGLDSMTVTGTVLGTAGYLSPEQANGQRATPASDRYALAVVAYELLTGTRPFESESATAEAAAHVHATVPSVCERGPDLPCELDPVFERALAKDPRDRYPTSAEFVGDLRRALADAAGMTNIVATPPAAPPRTAGRPGPPSGPPGRRRWPLVVLGLAAAAAAGAVIAAVMTSGGSDKATSTPPPQPRASVKTVTAQGTTVLRTVTTTPPTPATTAAPLTTTATAATTQASSTPAPPAPTGGNGHALNDQGYSKMRAGDYNGALPLLQQAVSALRGSGPSDPYEAYANYNLGYSLLKLRRCSEAVPYLQRAQRLEPQRSEPGQALAQAKSC